MVEVKKKRRFYEDFIVICFGDAFRVSMVMVKCRRDERTVPYGPSRTAPKTLNASFGKIMFEEFAKWIREFLPSLDDSFVRKKSPSSLPSRW